MEWKRNLAVNIFLKLSKFIKIEKGIVFLTFHNIEDNYITWFEDTIRYISSNYTIVNPFDIKTIIETDDYDNKIRICITIDDGYKSSKNIISKVLNRFNIKGLFFIPRGFINLNQERSTKFALNNFFPDSKQKTDISFNSLNDSDILSLISDGHEIGAHTRNHPKMNCINNLVKRDEIIESAKELEELYDIFITKFSFPFGKPNLIDNISMGIALKQYEFVFSNVRGALNKNTIHNRFIFRQNINPGDNILFINSIIQGKLNWRYNRERCDILNNAHNK